MKVTKPNDNQILIEDDLLKQFNLDVKSHTGLNTSGYNHLYQGLILIYRFPNMDASKQLFYGNKTSILTLLCSSIENIIDNKLMNEDDLDDIVSAIKNNKKRKERNSNGK